MLREVTVKDRKDMKRGKAIDDRQTYVFYTSLHVSFGKHALSRSKYTKLALLSCSERVRSKHAACLAYMSV